MPEDFEDSKQDSKLPEYLDINSSEASSSLNIYAEQSKSKNEENCNNFEASEGNFEKTTNNDTISELSQITNSNTVLSSEKASSAINP